MLDNLKDKIEKLKEFLKNFFSSLIVKVKGFITSIINKLFFNLDGFIKRASSLKEGDKIKCSFKNFDGFEEIHNGIDKFLLDQRKVMSINIGSEKDWEAHYDKTLVELKNKVEDLNKREKVSGFISRDYYIELAQQVRMESARDTNKIKTQIEETSKYISDTLNYVKDNSKDDNFINHVRFLAKNQARFSSDILYINQKYFSIMIRMLHIKEISEESTAETK